MYLHFYSNNPKSVKRSVLFSIFLRAYRLCSPQFIQDELELIRKTFSKLAYPEHFITKVHRDAKRKHSSPTVAPPERDHKPVLRLPFNKFTNDVLNPILRSHEIAIAHSSSNTLKSAVHKTRPSQRGGVYAVPCGECPKVYIGQTGRDLQTRIREHKYNVNRNYRGSALYMHRLEENHSVDWDRAAFNYRNADAKQRLVVEAALIQRVPNMNLTEGVTSVNPATSDLILKFNKKILENINNL